MGNRASGSHYVSKTLSDKKLVSRSGWGRWMEETRVIIESMEET